MDEQLEFLKLIATRLECAGIPYMVTGSMAMAVYSVPRMTRDIDIVVEYCPEDSVRICQLFESDCYVEVESIHEAAVRRSVFNIIHGEWIIKADFIVRKNEAYRKIEFDRRRQLDIEGKDIWVVAPEDLILSKLLWSRESNSEIQRRDARTMAESVADLDWSYIKEWAAALDLSDLVSDLREK